MYDKELHTQRNNQGKGPGNKVDNETNSKANPNNWFIFRNQSF